MSEFKPTPGRWTFKPHYGYGGADPNGEPLPFGYIVTTPFPVPIFELRPVVGHLPCEMEANARLMAAAPEMVELLEKWLSAFGSATGHGALSAPTRALLARIKGEA